MLARRLLKASALLAVVLAVGTALPVWADGPQVDSAKLVRTENGLSMTLQISGLTSGDAVTVWWVISEGQDTSVLRAAGHVIGDSGKGNFAGHVSEGESALLGPGLQDAESAQVTLIVRSHGPMDPSRITDQLFTPEESCAEPTCTNLLYVPLP
jgi:hypothetical protein